MDDIFMRELVIFIAVLAVFVGTVPMLVRGHHAEPVEAANEAASRSGPDGQVSAARGKSKRRRARDRDDAKKKNG